MTPPPPCLRPLPGPLYWSGRCLRCDHDIRSHAPFWRRWWARLHPSPAASSGDRPLSAPWGSDKGGETGG